MYDTSLRLGAHLSLWPEVVYLHAGTRRGCRALGVASTGGKVELANLPDPVRELDPYHAEDFLCIFEDKFDGTEGAVKGCGPDAKAFDCY